MGVSESKIREDAISCINFGYSNKKFRKLIKKMKKMDINSIRDSSGSTLLNLSCQQGRKSIIFELLNLGANPNIPNNVGMTPLHHSMNNGDEESVSMLLKHGCNPNVVSETATTPLIIAVKKGDEKLVELLFGINSNGGGGGDTFGASSSSFRSTSTPTIDGINITPIGGSSSNSNGSSNNLNSNIVDVNLCDKQKMTALMWAATEGNDSLVKFLISVGADVNRRDNQGRTAMFIAKSGSHYNIVNMLNEQFCKVNKIVLSKPSNSCNNNNNNSNSNLLNSISNNNNSNIYNNQNNVSQSSVALPSQNFFTTGTDSLASSWSSSDSNLNKQQNNNNSNSNQNNNNIDKQITAAINDNNPNILITNTTPNISNKSQLKRDHSTLHSTISSSSKDERYCKVCWERPSDIVSLWCGHISLCMFCSQYLQTCPICVQTIERVQRVFVS